MMFCYNLFLLQTQHTFIRFSKEEDICVKITSLCNKLTLLMLLMYILITKVLDVKRNQQIKVIQAKHS